MNSLYKKKLNNVIRLILLEICSLLRDELIEMLDHKKKRIEARKLNSVGQQYMKRAPFGKTNPEPMEEEADTDEEDGNDESDESEESHDEDEEEDLRTSYSPSRNNNELEPDSMDDQDTPDLNSSDQSAMWPLQ